MQDSSKGSTHTLCKLAVDVHHLTRKEERHDPDE